MIMNNLSHSTMSFGSTSREEELDTCSIISFGSHRSSNKMGSNYKNQKQLEIKVETVYSLLSMLTCNNIKEEMCNKFYTMSLDKRISLEMRSHGCIPLLIQLIHPIGEDTRFHEEDEEDEAGDGSVIDHDEHDEDGLRRDAAPGSEANLKESEIRSKACTALRNIIKYSEDTKAGKREMRVLQLLEEIRGFCDKFRRGKGDLNVSMAHPGEATSHLMKISFDEEHRVTICLLGGLHAIAELIFLDTKYHGNTTSPQCITVRRYAFMALTNLTFGDGTNKSILCSNKLFIRSLIEQLYSPSEELRQVTASVLRNLSWKADEQGKDTLREMGAVRTLMRSALESRKESTLKSILTALWNLSAHSTANKAEICAVDGALSFLVSTLNYQSMSNTMVIIENGGGILRNISSYIARHEHLRAILREHDCLAILLEQLKSPSLTIVSNACATLWNLSARCLQDQMKLIELGAVPMLRNLVNSKHKMISMGSAAALKNLSSAKSFHPYDGDSRPSSSRASSCSSSSQGPSLHARKAQIFRPELDDSLSETCDNLDSPKTSPSHLRLHPSPPLTRLNLPERMYTSYTAPFPTSCPYMSKSSSRDSLGSTHSEPVYYPFNNNHSHHQHPSGSSIPRSSSHGFNPPNVNAYCSNDISHLFHAYPIKINDNSPCKDQPCSRTSPRSSNDSLERRIFDQAKKNAENMLMSEYSRISSKASALSHNIMSSGFRYRNEDNFSASSTQNLSGRHLKRRNSENCSDFEAEKPFLHCENSLSTESRKVAHAEDKQCNDDDNRLFTLTFPLCSSQSIKSPDFEHRLPSTDSSLSINKKMESQGNAIEEETEDSIKRDDQTGQVNPVQNQSINYGENCTNSFEATPLMFSRTSSLGSISGLEAKSFGDDQSSVPSEFSKGASDPVSPDDLPDSPTQTDPLTCIGNTCYFEGNETDDNDHHEKLLDETRPSNKVKNNWASGRKSPYIGEKEHFEDKLEPIQEMENSIDINKTQIDGDHNRDGKPPIENGNEIFLESTSQPQETSAKDDKPSNLRFPKKSLSLYSLESNDLNSIKPPSCIDEASLSLESSNFPSMEFTKPQPVKIGPTTLDTRKACSENFLESTNPPSDMDQISGLSSSCGSLNSLDSDLADIPIIKELNPEATELIKKQTQDIIQLTESHNDVPDGPRITLQRTDTFNYDGQNESEDDSRATYICSPRRARIVKPVLRSQSSGNCVRRPASSTPSPSQISSGGSSSSLISKSRSLVIKGTKTTALRVSRSKSTPEGPNDQLTSTTAASIPSTPVKKVPPSLSYSSRTFVVRKRTVSSDISNINSNIKNRSPSIPTVAKLCNSASIHNISDRMNSIPSPVPSQASTSQIVKKSPVQSKIASLWKRSNNSEREPSISIAPKKENNSQNMSKSCTKGVNKSMSVGHVGTPSSLTRSSTYEKLPSTGEEATKMQSKQPKESSRVPLTKSRIRPTQDQISTSIKQNKAVRLEKRRTSLVN